MEVVSGISVVLLSLPTLRDTKTSRKGKEEFFFVFHGKLNTRTDRVKMRMIYTVTCSLSRMQNVSSTYLSHREGGV